MEFITHDFLEKTLIEQGKVSPITGETIKMVIMSHHKSFQDVLWVTDVVCVKVHQTTINKDNQYFEMDLAVPIYTDKVGLYHFFRHVSVQKKKIKPKDQEAMEVLVLMSHLGSFTNYVHPEGQMVKSSLEEINNLVSSV